MTRMTLLSRSTHSPTDGPGRVSGIFAFGTSISSVNLILIGRVVYGLGGENMTVALSTLGRGDGVCNGPFCVAGSSRWRSQQFRLAANRQSHQRCVCRVVWRLPLRGWRRMRSRHILLRTCRPTGDCQGPYSRQPVGWHRIGLLSSTKASRRAAVAGTAAPNPALQPLQATPRSTQRTIWAPR